MPNPKPKALLAFSGGLDTSFCIPYLQEKGYDVVTATVNTGGFTPKQLKEIAAKAKAMGVVKHYERDAQAALYDKFASYLIKANYLKGGVYPACVGPERNVITMETVEIAKKDGINVIVHGSTGAGNDQVRFDLVARALMPNCTILAPIRDENLTRDQEMDFLAQHGFPQKPKTATYSINVGLLGTTVGGGETHDPEKELPDDAFPTVKGMSDAKKDAYVATIQFKKSLPVALNGKKCDGIAIIRALSAAAAERGFGKDYHIGTTIIGIKGRIAFEAPALKILVKAHTELEKLVLTSKEIFWKTTLGTVYGDLMHEGLYFDPLARDIEAFLDAASAHVEGEVKVRVQLGALSVISMKSPYSLMRSKLGTYGEKTGSWTGQDAKGFCMLYGMESSNAFLRHQK